LGLLMAIPMAGFTKSVVETLRAKDETGDR